MREVFILNIIFSSIMVGAQPNCAKQNTTFYSIYSSLLDIESTELMYNEIVSTAIRGVSTHQYFLQRNWSKGGLTYNHDYYPTVEMLFDTEQQQIIVKHPRGGRSDGVAPDMNLVSEFLIFDHTFRKYVLNGQTVFCDEIYVGNGFLFLAVRKKKLVAQKGVQDLAERDEFYLQLDGQTFQIKTKGNFKRLFPSNKDNLKKLREAGLKFSIRNEDATKKFLTVFDSLISLPY